jgi:hypothetical protein
MRRGNNSRGWEGRLGMRRGISNNNNHRGRGGRLGMRRGSSSSSSSSREGF